MAAFGYCCKQIRGKLHYFGPWADPDGALKNNLQQKDAHPAGPRQSALVQGQTRSFLNAAGHE
jgi:hypothetical protein